MSESHSPKSVQDTGNPVLDSVVNVMLNTNLLMTNFVPDYDQIKRLHALFCELYAKEPKREPGERKPARSLKEMSEGQ